MFAGIRAGGTCRRWTCNVYRFEYISNVSCKKRDTRYCHQLCSVNSKDSAELAVKLSDDAVRIMFQVQNAIEQSARSNIGEENIAWLLTIGIFVGALFLIDWTTGIVDEALELAEYDHDPRATEVFETDIIESEGLQMSIPEQIEVEGSLNSTLRALESREHSCTFLILCWALFTIGVEAFFRTPDTPLQP